MKLVMLNNTAASGAVCLDGTPGGFYFSPATSPENINDWQIYFTGGGWCYDEIDCWGRSNTALGSSTSWPPASQMGGMLSPDCKVNPDFCNFNRVQLMYCDGNSFSGNRDAAVQVKGLDGKVKPLYFRGRRILDETLKALAANFGLTKAANVLLTGCSAGGLATFLHTDYVHQQLSKATPAMKVFKSAPISGFFLNHATVENKPVYPIQMQYIFNLANSTNGLNDRCIAALKPEDRWQCNFAQFAYAYTESQIMPLNSALDSWQTACIFTSELVPGFPNQTTTANGICSAAAGWTSCSQNPEACSQDQIKAMNQYIEDYDRDTQGGSQGVYDKAGNGAFIHSCHTHCEAQDDTAFNKFAVNGVTMQQALSKWWKSAGTDPAKDHSYQPCLYKDGPSPPRQCNPTC